MPQETPTQAHDQLTRRRADLLAELAQVDQRIALLETPVLVSGWWQNPSGPGGRGTVYHDTRADRQHRPSSGPQEIALHRALSAGLTPCRACRPVSPRAA